MAIKFRAGDVVSIHAIVKFNYAPDEDKHIAVDIPNSICSGLWIEPGAATMVQQKIVLGELVTFNLDGTGMASAIRGGTVAAISNHHAWIDMGGGEYCTRLLSTIKRAEDEA